MAWQTPPDWQNGMTVNETHLDIINGDLLDLNDRVNALNSASSSLNSQVGALNSAVGMPWSGGSAQSRLSKLEQFGSVTLIQSSTQSIPNSADTIIGNWMLSGFQIGSLWTPGNNYIQVPEDGFYLFTGTVVFRGTQDATYNGTTGQRVAYFTVGAPTNTGNTTLASNFMPSIASTIAQGDDATVPLPLAGGAILAAGTRVYMYAYQNSGKALPTHASYGGRTVFSARRLA